MPTEIELASALVKKLAEVVIGGEDVVGIPAPAGSFVSFCYPGIAVDGSDFDFSFLSPSGAQGSAAADFASLVNSIPPSSGRFLPTAETIPDIYAEILRDKQLPQVSLADSEKKELAKSLAVVVRDITTIDPATGAAVQRPADTPLYERYKELEQAYISAALAYRSLQVDLLFRGDERSKVEWALKGPLYQQQRKTAYNSWLPVKGEVERALGVIAALSNRGPESYWLELKERFDNSKFSSAEGEEYYFTKYFPSKFWDAAHVAGWTKFTMTHNEVHEINESSSMSASLGGGFGGGLWNVSGSGSYSEQKTYFKSDSQNLSIDLKLTMIPIRRTWLDATVFSNRAWRLDENINKSVYSDGGAPPQGRMPAIATAMIVVRELKLGADMSTTENSSFASQLKVSMSGGWGPFSVRGNYSRNTSRTTHDYVMSAAGIEAPGMQIIGFVCRTTPKSPNPDDTLNWPV